MFKWLSRFFRQMKKCRHQWKAIRVINYVRYRDSREHLESKCIKCGLTCDHPALIDTGSWSGHDGLPRHSVRCKICNMHTVVSGEGKARFLYTR